MSNSTPTKIANVATPQSAVMNTYSRLDVTFSHGKGLEMWDVNGRRY
jgi:acetylornithine/succinyldiaminopimelate/putrescine aminotransferase